MVNSGLHQVIVVVLTAALIACHTPTEAQDEINSATVVAAQSTIKRSISGFIRDDASGEPIAYANVFLVGTSHGTTTNEDGYFVLSEIAPGSYKLNVTMIGYQAVLDELLVCPGPGSHRNKRSDRPSECVILQVSLGVLHPLGVLERSIWRVRITSASALASRALLWGSTGVITY